MATSVGNIHVGLTVDTRGARAFSSAANVIGRDSDRIRRSLGGTQRSVAALRGSMSQGWRSRIFSDMIRQASQTNNEIGKLRASMLGLAALTGTSITGAFAGTFLLQTADQANRLNNQLRTVTESEEELVAVRERLYAVSQLTRSDMAATVTLYARITRAAEEFGKSQADIVRVTETIQKAFAIGGASQAEAQGAAIQLSQGIASDRFSGEEYRSVSENAPVLLQEMARGLGVTIGKLREMAHAGQLTGRVVTDAILGASDAIDEDFNKTIVTVGQGLNRLGNAFLMYTGDVDASLGVTQRMAAALGNLAENFDEIAPIIAGAAGIGLSIFGGKVASGVIGGRVDQIRSVRREHDLLLQSQVKELGAVREKLALERQSQAALVATSHAASTTAKARHQANLAQKRSLAEIVNLRRQELALARQVAVSQRRMSAASTAMALAGRAGSGLLNLLGGPTGIVFAAATIALGTFVTRAAEAEERSRKLTKELHDLGLISDRAAGYVDDVTESIEDLAGDELRNKIREIGIEIDRLTKQQNPFEMMFGFNYDEQALGNIRQEIMSRLPRGEFGPGRNGSFLLQLMRDVETGVKSSEDAIAELDARASLGNTTAQWDDWASRLRITFELLNGHIQRVDQLQEKVSALARAGNDASWVQRHAEQLKALDAENENIRNWLDSLRSVSGEMVRVAGLTEDEARLEQVTDDILEAWEDINEEKGISGPLSRELAQEEAKAVIAAEDRAEALKKSNEAMAEFAADMAELNRELAQAGDSIADRDAAENVREMVNSFLDGKLHATELESRLNGIASTNVSGGMQDLIHRILEAIPIMAQLLRMFRMMPGSSIGNAVVTASDRARAFGAAAGVTARDTASRLEAAAMSPEQARRAGLIEELMAPIEGGLPRTKADAAALADEIIRLEDAADGAADASSAAADAAEQYRDGMIELNRELAVAPLDEFYREVISTAEGMGIANSEIEAYIAALKSGDLDAAPAKFRAIAAAMREINATNLLRDLQFETDQLLRSDTEQRVAETLRGTGLTESDPYGALIAAQTRLNETLKTGKEIAKDFFGGLAQDLRNGVSFAEALSNAFGRLADRLLDMAVDSAIQMFLQMLVGGIGGSTFGVSSVTPLGFGGTAGTYGIPGYAGGTDFHAGGLARIFEKGGEILDLPRGTRVIPHDVSVKALAEMGQAGQPIIFSPTTHIDARGSNMSEGQMKAVLDQRDRQWREQLPTLVKTIVDKPRRAFV